MQLQGAVRGLAGRAGGVAGRLGAATAGTPSAMKGASCCSRQVDVAQVGRRARWTRRRQTATVYARAAGLARPPAAGGDAAQRPPPYEDLMRPSGGWPTWPAVRRRVPGPVDVGLEVWSARWSRRLGVSDPDGAPVPAPMVRVHPRGSASTHGWAESKPQTCSPSAACTPMTPSARSSEAGSCASLHGASVGHRPGGLRRARATTTSWTASPCGLATFATRMTTAIPRRSSLPVRSRHRPGAARSASCSASWPSSGADSAYAL